MSSSGQRVPTPSSSKPNPTGPTQVVRPKKKAKAKAIIQRPAPTLDDCTQAAADKAGKVKGIKMVKNGRQNGQCYIRCLPYNFQHSNVLTAGYLRFPTVGMLRDYIFENGKWHSFDEPLIERVQLYLSLNVFNKGSRLAVVIPLTMKRPRGDNGAIHPR